MDGSSARSTGLHPSSNSKRADSPDRNGAAVDLTLDAKSGTGRECPLTDILLIEDEVPLRAALTRALSRNGYTVLTAGDGKAGLALLSRHRFRLVITDIFMPENDGLEVIIRQMAAQPDSRILAMSGFCGYTDVPTILKMAAALGSQRTLVKPFRLIDFLDAVYALVNQS